MRFTTSWDDGHPLDLKLADLLDRHGLPGTFYVPLRNREGLPVMEAGALRQLDGRFEIGSHTLDHHYADRGDAGTWARQVIDGKAALEQALGHAVAGFCYPGGRADAAARQVVRGAGFAYARSIVNLHLDAGDDRFRLPTTAQFFPHPRGVLLRNWLRGGQVATRARAAPQPFRPRRSATAWIRAAASAGSSAINRKPTESACLSTDHRLHPQVVSLPLDPLGVV